MSIHHCPLEVRHGAGYCVQTVIVGERTVVFGDVGELAPGTGATGGVIGIGAGAPRIGDRLSPRHAAPFSPSPTIPSVSSRFAKPTKRKTISPAMLDELDFLKGQLGRQPDRAWLSRMLLLGFGIGGRFSRSFC
jgi:hypothetical protein